MIRFVKKRDGSLAPFESERITLAIERALREVGKEDKKLAEELTHRVVTTLQQSFGELFGPPHVEEIQDVVEEVLIKAGLTDAARAYILYREQHRRLREIRELVDPVLVEQYLNGTDWRVRENSNMTFSLQGLNVFLTEKIISKYWLSRIYPPHIRKAHEEGDFHIHDLGTLGPYCVGWDLLDLLRVGFRGVRGKVESKPARHFRVALLQAANFLYSLQGEAAGAQAFSNLDTLLAPFIAYDELSETQVKQSLQEFVYNLNVPTRVGFQTPFTNCTLDVRVPKFMEDEPAIIGGKPVSAAYGEFQREMDMFNRAFAEVMAQGDARNRVFTFPIPTYNITNDFPWDAPALSPMWAATARYGIPYFANFINSDMKPEDVRSMCLHPDEEIFVKAGGKIRRVKIGTFLEDVATGWGDDGWSKPAVEFAVLGLNARTYRTEWIPVRKLLRIFTNRLVRIKTEDGRYIRVSLDHLVPVLTAQGLKNKLAKDVEVGDLIFSLKKSSAFHYNKDILAMEGLGRFDGNWAWLLGFFTADGNYLYTSGGKRDRKLRGIQFTFHRRSQDLKAFVKTILESRGFTYHDEQDPRWETDYIYVYHRQLAKTLYRSGFRKYGRLPDLLFDSPVEIVVRFLEGFFAGGYAAGKEVHINDPELSRDLVLLYTLVGIPVTYRLKEKSQSIRIQHAKAALTTDDRLASPILAERVPGWAARSTYLVPGLQKSRMVGLTTLTKYKPETEFSRCLERSDVYPAQVVEVELEEFPAPIPVYDLELEREHLFVHSLGTVTHNCCHLRLDNRELRRRGGGLFGSDPLTGSIGVVTINLPRIGYLAKSEAEFLERLSELIKLAARSLIIKRKVLERLTDQGLYPYSRFYLRGVKEATGEYWANHFSTIGVVGLNEACLNLLGCSIASKEGIEFSIRVLDFMRKKLVEFQEATPHFWNLEATPAEGTSYRLAMLDKARFPKIIVANEQAVKEGAAPYYTNSSQLPVGQTDDLFLALKLQEPLQTRYTGGTVFHIWLGERLASGDAARILVQKVMESFRIPYITLTPTFSICPEHGYIAGEHAICPECGRETEIYSRVVGYLRPVEQWNAGKQSEFRDRRTFTISSQAAVT